MTRLAMLLLVSIALVLAGVIAIEANPDKFVGGVPLPANDVRLGRVARHAGDMRQVQTWVDVILARPLFEPARRPPATAAGSGTSGPGFPRLTGIIVMPHQREAIFAVPGRAQPIVVTVGSRLNGVLIKSIDTGWIVVVDAAGARMLRPSFNTGTVAPVAPSSAPVIVDRPPLPSGPHVSPFASIRGLSGRPLGLAAQPDATSPSGDVVNTVPSLPALAAPGGSP